MLGQHLHAFIRFHAPVPSSFLVRNRITGRFCSRRNSWVFGMSSISSSRAICIEPERCPFAATSDGSPIADARTCERRNARRAAESEFAWFCQRPDAPAVPLVRELHWCLGEAIFATPSILTPAFYDRVLFLAFTLHCLFLMTSDARLLGGCNGGTMTGALSLRSEATSRGARMLRSALGRRSLRGLRIPQSSR